MVLIGGNRCSFSRSEGCTQNPPPPDCFFVDAEADADADADAEGRESEAGGRSSVGVMSLGDGAELEAEDDDPRGSRPMG